MAFFFAAPSADNLRLLLVVLLWCVRLENDRLSGLGGDDVPGSVWTLAWRAESSRGAEDACCIPLALRLIDRALRFVGFSAVVVVLVEVPAVDLARSLLLDLTLSLLFDLTRSLLFDLAAGEVLVPSLPLDR